MRSRREARGEAGLRPSASPGAGALGAGDPDATGAPRAEMKDHIWLTLPQLAHSVSMSRIRATSCCSSELLPGRIGYEGGWGVEGGACM